MSGQLSGFVRQREGKMDLMDVANAAAAGGRVAVNVGGSGV